MFRKLKWQIPWEPFAAWNNWCQGPVPGRGPAVEKHCPKAYRNTEAKTNFILKPSVTHSLTIFCSKITNHNNGQRDVDKTCFCLHRKLNDGNESNPKSDAVFCQTSRKGMYVRSTSENVFFSYSSPLHRPTNVNCIQIPYKTPKKPCFCYFFLYKSPSLLLFTAFVRGFHPSRRAIMR